MISHKYKFICPRIGKNASSTLVVYFKKFDKKLIDEGHRSVLGKGFAAFLKGPYCRFDHSTYFKFAFSRNPFDRLVSAFYEYRKADQFADIKNLVRRHSTLEVEKTIKDFESFVEMTHVFPHIHWNCQYDMIHNKGKLLVDFIGKVETLGRDINVICKKVGIKNDQTAIPQVRSSVNKKDYTTYYTSSLREKVGLTYAKDLSYFGYGFNK